VANSPGHPHFPEAFQLNTHLEILNWNLKQEVTLTEILEPDVITAECNAKEPL
jgi:hypothetical protein